jgi:hypothetical protein
MTPALFLALTLMTSSAPAPSDSGGEPLPPGAPTEPYQLSAWCYGALGEYLLVYDRVKPDLIDIDREFGPPEKEPEPFQSDMIAARQELKMIGGAVTAAEKASPRPIAPEGVEAMHQGAAIWSVMETKTRRELARAWLVWALPDRCDSVSRDLAAKSLLLGKALSYNNGPAEQGVTESGLPPLPDQADEAPAPTPPDRSPPPATPAHADIAPPRQAPVVTQQAAPVETAPAPAVVQQSAPQEAPPAPSPPPAQYAEPAVTQPTPTPPPAQAAAQTPPPKTETAPADQSSEPTL